MGRSTHQAADIYTGRKYRLHMEQKNTSLPSMSTPCGKYPETNEKIQPRPPRLSGREGESNVIGACRFEYNVYELRANFWGPFKPPPPPSPLSSGASLREQITFQNSVGRRKGLQARQKICDEMTGMRTSFFFVLFFLRSIPRCAPERRSEEFKKKKNY